DKQTSIKKIQKLRYPKRIQEAIIYNSKKIFDIGEKISSFNMRYIIKCLHKHYFLVDTTQGGVQYMELYDLKTNHLVNTFRRQNLNNLNFIIDIPDIFAISNNNKLLAYKTGNQVNLYLIDCGLEIASITLDIGEISVSDPDYDYLMQFFDQDEKLLIYQLANKWAIWDIFGSIQRSIKLEVRNEFEFDLKIKNIFVGSGYQLKRSNSFIIIIKDNKPVIYDDLISDKYSEFLKKNSDNQNLVTLPLELKYNNIVWEIDSQKSELDEYYHILEPWLRIPYNQGPRYSVFLDKTKEILLLIGSFTIQVWRERNKKRTLEFISVISKSDGNEDVMNEIEEIKYDVRKFKLSIIQPKNKIFEMGIADNDVINIAIEACHALKYLYKMSHKHDSSFIFQGHYVKFKKIIEETRNIIVRFINLYPITWRLLDFRFNLMRILIDAKEYSLIKYILFNEKEASVNESEERIIKTLDFVASNLETKSKYSQEIKQNKYSLLHEKSLHMPSLWESEPSRIKIAFSEYYSNKAVEEIGWMNTVIDIIPRLYDDDLYKSYVQLLFYKPCFCAKELDASFTEFIEIPPSTKNSLKVFIPITQFIPQDSKLKLKEINQNIISNIRMVPLIDFTTNKRKRPIVCPGKFISQREYYSPFLKLIKKIESNDNFYYNPSMEAIMNLMWHSSELHWRRTLYIFILYFITYSIISWTYIAHIQVTGEFQHIMMGLTIILFYYLTYYHIMVEYNQLLERGRIEYFTDPFNLVDLFAYFVPLTVSTYVLVHYYTFEIGFKNAESSLYMAFIIFISVIGIWYEL
ncbi:8021_t:CDS:2, partial [Scutellospora calospora]